MDKSILYQSLLSKYCKQIEKTSNRPKRWSFSWRL